jgi:hypothetical protein
MSKQQELLTLQHTVTPHMTAICSIINVTTLNVTELINSPKHIGLCFGYYTTSLQFLILVDPHQTFSPDIF